MEIIATITIPKYIRQVKMSEAQRATYFEWNGITIKAKKSKVPRAFFKDRLNYPENVQIEDLKDNFCISIVKKGKVIDYIKEDKRLPSPKSMTKDFKYLLYSNEGGEYQAVIANPKKKGTPSMYLINGQDIYNGFLRDFMLGKVMGAIKENYKPHIKNLPVISEYPIKIHCDIYDTIKHVHDKSKDDFGQRWDVDNYAFPYVKAFPDLLTKEGLLKDDDRLHMPSNVSASFIPISNHEDRKLVFIISKESRPEIVENEVYKKYHKDSYESEDTLLVLEEEDLNKFKNINNETI